MSKDDMPGGCYSGAVGEVRRQVHMLKMQLIQALPREEIESEGTQHCLIANALLSQVEYHLKIARMKGVS